MSLARLAVISQFRRDTQALRDALTGLTHSQLSDPSFQAGTVQERLALVAAHYYREGEVLAYQAGQQFDPPMEPDDEWQMEETNLRCGWMLSELQADMEDAWAFYDEMLKEVTENDYMAYIQSHNGMIPRVAYELSREITMWRLRS